MNLSDIIQSAAVMVALAAAVIALVIAWRDRVNARNIAAEDRRAALEQAKLMFDLEALLRLLENLNRGGSPDRQESQRMGAEALSLVGVIGPELLPEEWKRRVEMDSDGLRQMMSDPETEFWQKGALEAQIAVNTVTQRIRTLVHRD